MPTEQRFRDVFNIVEPHVEDRYHIPVVIGDVAHPFTGDLDGAEIRVDYENSAEDACFILAHLFGHTVQWCVNVRYRELGQAGLLENPTEAELEELITYEEQACGYSLQLLHEAGVHDLDNWLSDYARCDLAYLLHFYRTGEKRPFRSFWKADQKPIAAIAIPAFEPQKWIWRFGDDDGGIVI